MSNVEENEAKYKYQTKRMSAGVALDMSLPDHKDTTRKALRVGINSAHVNSAALAHLLVDLGVITLEQYTQYIADTMEVEADDYEKALSKHFKKKISLAAEAESQVDMADPADIVYMATVRNPDNGRKSLSMFAGTNILNGEFFETEEEVQAKWVKNFGEFEVVCFLDDNAPMSPERFVELFTEKLEEDMGQDGEEQKDS
jgi:hypothetical protein